MSEPNVDWYVHRIKTMLGEIDKLIFESTATNSIKEIISSNTNEIEINLHTIIRKLGGVSEDKKQHQWEFYANGSFCKICGAAIGSGQPCR